MKVAGGGDSPLAVADLPHHAQHGLVGECLQLAQQLGEELRPGADDREQVGGNLARQRQEHVFVLAEFDGEFADDSLARRRLLGPLDLAEVGRLDPDAAGELAEGKTGIFPGARLARPAQVLREGMAGVGRQRVVYRVVNTTRNGRSSGFVRPRRGKRTFDGKGGLPPRTVAGISVLPPRGGVESLAARRDLLVENVGGLPDGGRSVFPQHHE